MPPSSKPDILDAAFAEGLLVVCAACPGLLWKEQGTAEALSTIAVGVVECESGMHGQAIYLT